MKPPAVTLRGLYGLLRKDNPHAAVGSASAFLSLPFFASSAAFSDSTRWVLIGCGILFVVIAAVGFLISMLRK